MTEWVLGIDLGSGGPKVAAVTTDGEIRATALRGVSVDVGTDGSATQDAAQWQHQLSAAVQDVAAAMAGDELVSIGITGQWGSSVPVAADGTAVGPVLMWADSRGARYARGIVGGPVSVGGYSPRKMLSWIRLTGGGPNPAGADPTGHWQVLSHDYPHVARATAYVLEPVDYLGFLLTGEVAATPASMILSWLTDNRLPRADAAGMDDPGIAPHYVDALVRKARRDPKTLPPLRRTGSIQGGLLPEVAGQWGLPAGTPVMTGIPDFHAAAIGSGSVGPFQTHMAISTTAWFSAPVPFKKTDVWHSIATVPGLRPELPLVINNVETAGAALTWLREQIIAPPDGLSGGGSGIGAEGAAAVSLEPTYEELIELAAGVPAGAEGVLFAPWLAGERSPVDDRDLRGTWLNLSLRTTRSVLVRSVLEGVALNARWLFTPYEKFLGQHVGAIRILGGGAQSELWCQIMADVLDRPLERVADPRNAQLRGVALWSLVGLGRLSLAQAAANVPIDQVFRPDPNHREIYDDMFAEYRRIHPMVKSMYKRLRRIPTR